MTDTPPQQWLPGRILQTAREQAGLSKRQAARTAGITPTFYKRIEDGGHYLNGEYTPVNPSVDKLIAAAQAVGADPHAVLSAAGHNPLELQRKTLHDKVEGLPDRLIPAALTLIDQLDS